MTAKGQIINNPINCQILASLAQSGSNRPKPPASRQQTLLYTLARRVVF
jgi:hypothetical protein